MRKKRLIKKPVKNRRELHSLTIAQLKARRRFLPQACGFNLPRILTPSDPLSLFVLEYYDLYLRILLRQNQKRVVTLSDVYNTHFERLLVRSQMMDLFNDSYSLSGSAGRYVEPRLRRELSEHISKARDLLAPRLARARNRHIASFPPLMEGAHPIDRDLFVLTTAASGLIDGVYTAQTQPGDSCFLIRNMVEKLAGLYTKHQILEHLSPQGTLLVDEHLELNLQSYSGNNWGDMEVRVPSTLFHQLSQSNKTVTNELKPIHEYLEPTETLDEVILPQHFKTDIRALIAQHLNTLDHKRGLNFLFMGAPGTGKTMLAKAIARELGKKLLKVTFDQIAPKSLPQIVVYYLERAKQKGCVVLFDECEDMIGYNPFIGLSDGWAKVVFEKYRGVAIFTTNHGVPTGFERRMSYILQLKNPTAQIRETILTQELAALKTQKIVETTPDSQSVSDIAHKYSLSGGFYSQVLQLAAANSPVGTITPQAMENAFETFETIIAPGATDEVRQPRISLDQIKVSAELKKQIESFIEYSTKITKHKNPLLPQGATALFSGPPGTGKTITAEAIATQLGIPFRRTSPSTFTSMWFGQTEKNIKQVFKEAQRENYLLFIDEAEGLFSDRRAGNHNVDTRIANELLQQVEMFKGTLIIATNYTEMMDTAFARRFLFHMHFTVPDETTRKVLWAQWKEGLGITDEQIGVFAERFKLSGGEIRNIAVKAQATGEVNLEAIERLCQQALDDRTGQISKPIGIRG